MKNIKGLSTNEAKKRLSKFGLNKIEEKKVNPFVKFLHWLFSPITLMLIAADLLSYFSHKIFDAYLILFLILINYIISFWQEKKADDAIDYLNKQLAFKVKILRDNNWTEVDSTLIVPGDIIKMFAGDLIPADLEILEEKNLTVNEASLTGESLPKEKKEKEIAYSGSYIATGLLVGRVDKTGSKTFFGSAIIGLEKVKKRSILEKDILTISKFLSILSIGAVIILTIIFLLEKYSFHDILVLDLSLIIAGIPIALPTVMTLIISMGVSRLSKSNVLVRRLASLEDLANVDILFTDKTGTLTKNEISVSRTIGYKYSENDILLYAYLAAQNNNYDLINKAIINEFEKNKISAKGFKIVDFIPADSNRKRNSVLVEGNGKKYYISVGAVQIIKTFCKLNKKIESTIDKEVEESAKNGYRVLAVAINKNKTEEKNMEFAGLLLLSDPLREEAKDTIIFLKENGVDVTMVTGDNKAIGERIGREIGLSGREVFSEVLPADKYNLVNKAKLKHTVAITGDGINDLPAVKSADVGIAVDNAVDALKKSADIILLSSGILYIKDAIIEARKIFARLQSYAIYRISESFRIIIIILILGALFRLYPLSPIQLILLALLNDLPIISLAFNRVKVSRKPAKIQVKKRFFISLLFGLTGIVNSLIFLVITLKIFHYDWDIISTAFFLKLTVSGHLLIFIAHTEEKWYKYLPSKEVVLTIIITQLLATLIAVSGFFMTGINIFLAIFIWLWAIFWMQISELMKNIQRKLFV